MKRVQRMLLREPFGKLHNILGMSFIKVDFKW